MDTARPRYRAPTSAHMQSGKRVIEFQVSACHQISMLGLQLVWSTEMAYASPYLLSLGARVLRSNEAGNLLTK